MERLTWKYNLKGYGGVGLRSEVSVEDAVCHLAAYEDTGLDVEEYKKHADAIKKLDIEHMHDLLQAEKDGRLVVLPCKVGQKVWFCDCLDEEEICPATVVSIELNFHTPFNSLWVRIEYLSDCLGKQEYHNRWDLMFGKTVFLTREEAEAALKKREAMRLIDADSLSRNMSTFIDDAPMHIMAAVYQCIDLEPTFVQPPNTPLTPEELRNLALRKWVWIDVLDASKEHGAGSAYYRKSDCNRPNEVFSCGYPGWEIMFEYADYGKTWVAYRQKPKEGTYEQNKN